MEIQEYRPGDAGRPGRTITYNLHYGPDVARYVARHQFAWPGGYELAAVLADCTLLCADCCREEYREIRTAPPGSCWQAIGLYNSAESDVTENCEHCGREIG